MSTSTRRIHVPDVSESSTSTTQGPLSSAMNNPIDCSNQTITITTIIAVSIAAVSIFFGVLTMLGVSAYFYLRHRGRDVRDGKDRLISSSPASLTPNSSSSESSYGKPSESKSVSVFSMQYTHACMYMKSILRHTARSMLV